MDTLLITALQIQTETPNIIKITIPTTNQEAITPIRIYIAEPKTMQSAIDYTRALQHLPVTGRLHIKEHVQYWKKKIHAPDLIINWLRFGIPLFSKNLLHLTKQPDPLQYLLTDTQMLWLNGEIRRLSKIGAIVLASNSDYHPSSKFHQKKSLLDPTLDHNV
ncbi:16650_t:CDS:2 [Acaulospora morrowiae]|uniref:16650_t:CDS:1 n=1 Tax=Acaulospora morrowiae TaxID=94023 RepID=A0A9N8YTK7_9GLOM|nr:16650_t:CDS:2 [Acaulospora morrowiae]